jgi:hypothetical protein
MYIAKSNGLVVMATCLLISVALAFLIAPPTSMDDRGTFLSAPDVTGVVLGGWAYKELSAFNKLAHRAVLSS